MYVCMYVCMYVGMYVGMYVCIYIYIHLFVETLSPKLHADHFQVGSKLAAILAVGRQMSDEETVESGFGGCRGWMVGREDKNAVSPSRPPLGPKVCKPGDLHSPS